MIGALVLAIFAIGAIAVLLWRGSRDASRSSRYTAPGDEGRVSGAWLDEEERRRADDDR